MFFKKRKLRKEFDNLSRRGVFFYQTGDLVVKADPLQTYVKLKETGLDVMYNDLKGALRGNEAKLKAFAQYVCGAFNVDQYDVKTGAGLTTLDLIRLFMAYMRYLGSLKKKVILLQDFAPDMEARLKSIFENTQEVSDSTGGNSSSDSTSTQEAPSPSQDSPTTTEQAEPSTD